MTEFIHWIEAQADEPDPAIGATTMAELISPQQGELSPQESSPRGVSWPDLPIDTITARTAAADIEDLELREEEDWDRDPDLWLYRRKTTGLLRRYMQWSLEAGRVPSLLGRELFRAKISAYTSTTFEARVIVR
ncbi:MAG TPA: hypothetical protein VFF64_15180 [Candidatus Eremiobacteraceae bacterium]|nr:hypothetical protein [Candidatus Eremiobacteraceae bacterium]